MLCPCSSASAQFLVSKSRAKHSTAVARAKILLIIIGVVLISKANANGRPLEGKITAEKFY